MKQLITHVNKLTPSELRFLLILSNSAKGLTAYTLFRRLGIPMPSFIKLVSRLTEKKLINDNNADFYVITDTGREFLTIEKTSISERYWRKVPKNYLKAKMQVTEMYIPSLKLLDKSFFHNNNII